jgi:outer membrane protein
MPNPCMAPPPSARKPITCTYSCTEPTVLPVAPDVCESLGLVDLVDIALQNSPLTRAAWYQAKQAAAAVGTARGLYLPSLNLSAFWIKDQIPQLSIDSALLFRETVLGFQFSTSYLLFDFGGRNGNVCSALSALHSLEWQYEWQVQSVMIEVLQSYYNYCNARGIFLAAEATLADQLTTLEAAAALRKAGVVGLSDELQAQTSLVQAQIFLESQRGILNVALATLVQSLGLPPDTPICAVELPESIAADEVCADMAIIMQAAKEHRADLKARRAIIRQRCCQIRTAKSALLPTLTTDLSYGKQSIDDHAFLDQYDISIYLNIPLFNSFADINALRARQAALLEAQAHLDDEELSAYLAVLSDYYELVANQKILKFSYNYLEIATENRTVAFANYKAGITSIIDLMIANNALNLARQQLVDAKTNFLTSLANLAYDTGSLRTCDLACDYPPWLEKTGCP